MSPGSMVKYFEASDTIVGIFQIISLVLSLCRTWPLTFMWISTSPGFGTWLAGTNGEQGQAPSNPLAISQGWPFCLHCSWTSTRVTSNATAHPIMADITSSGLQLRNG